MDRVCWTKEEDAVAIVLNMWGITPETIGRLLTNKRAMVRGIQEGIVAGMVATTPQYERTTNAVQGRLARIRKTHPEIWSNEGSWNRNAVPAFLENSQLDRDLVRNLLTLTPDDINLIIKVCSLFFFSLFSLLFTMVLCTDFHLASNSGSSAISKWNGDERQPVKQNYK